MYDTRKFFLQLPNIACICHTLPHVFSDPRDIKFYPLMQLISYVSVSMQVKTLDHRLVSAN